MSNVEKVTNLDLPSAVISLDSVKVRQTTFPVILPDNSNNL
jgi:hypothetical protein